MAGGKSLALQNWNPGFDSSPDLHFFLYVYHIILLIYKNNINGPKVIKLHYFQTKSYTSLLICKICDKSEF